MPGCRSANVPNHLLMCRRHWHLVPAELKSEVWRTWHARKRARSVPNRLSAMREYHKAHDAAIGAASDKEDVAA